MQVGRVWVKGGSAPLTRIPDRLRFAFERRPATLAAETCHSERKNLLPVQCGLDDTFVGMDVDFPKKSYAS
jgi:hypothetical protein